MPPDNGGYKERELEISEMLALSAQDEGVDRDLGHQDSNS